MQLSRQIDQIHHFTGNWPWPHDSPLFGTVIHPEVVRAIPDPLPIWLVVAISKNMKVNGKDYPWLSYNILYIMEHIKCSKPPSSFQIKLG